VLIHNLQEEFIGRTKELSIFSEWLNAADSPWILFFHDSFDDGEKKGGIGKTSLLRKCFILSKESYSTIIPIFVDFFDVGDRNSIVVVKRLIQTLQERYRDWSATHFEEIFNEYYEVLSTLKRADLRIWERLRNAFISDLAMLRDRMIETNSYLVLFLDTFEVIEHNPGTAVLHASQKFPDNYKFDRMRVVITGRNAIDWSQPNWEGRESEIRSVPLTPFNLEETAQYLSANGKIELTSEVLQAIYDNTEGRPILLGLVIDVLLNGTMTLEELIDVPKQNFKEVLVDQVNSLNEPVKWAILFMAHIYQRFNKSLLDLIMNEPGLREILPTIKYQELLEILPSLSFVRRANDGADFVLHDEMRRLVNKYCWSTQDVDRSFRSSLSTFAIKYYEACIAETNNEETRQIYIVEELFHVLFRNTDEGFAFFQKYFVQALDLSLRAFARSLLQVTQEFKKFLSTEQTLDLNLAETRLLQQEENPGEALKIYQALESNSDWAEKHKAMLLDEKGHCYQQMHRYDEAIANFRASLELEDAKKSQQRYAEIIQSLGFTYRLKGLYPEAMYYYDESLSILKKSGDLPKYALTLNSRGNLYRLMGKFEEALQDCKLGLKIRRNLWESNQGRLLDVALSLSTLAHVYMEQEELAGAEHYYGQAFEIYNRLEDKDGITGTYNGLGRILLARGDLEGALKNFELVERLAHGTELMEAQIVSLNGQGRVFILQGEYEEAVKHFEQATGLAHQIANSKREAENLLYLSEALEHQDRPMNQFLSNAKRISSKNAYYDLLGHAEEFQGDIDYKAHEYYFAFKHYRAAARYMAQYNPVQFKKFRQKLVDVLIDTPNNFLPGALDALLSYWYDLKLDKRYPELLNVCKEVRRHMIL
jgi:tetratricopeptide (TPR) repeat protein